MQPSALKTVFLLSSYLFTSSCQYEEALLSLLSAESEYMTMVAALKELKWIKGIVVFMCIVHSGAMDL